MLNVVIILWGLWGCSEKNETPEDSAQPEPESHPICNALSLPTFAYDAQGPSVFQRHQPAGDFSVPLRDGSEWTLSEQWTGCENYIFIPDDIAISDLDSNSYWSTGVLDLLVNSPLNTHYFFVSRGSSAEDAESMGAQMQAWIDETIAGLSENQANWWVERLHVVAGPSNDLEGLVKDAFSSPVAYFGFAIDREQNIRGLGSFAHVSGYDSALNNANAWPFEQRLFAAGYESHYFNFEVERQTRLDAVDATIVDVLGGDIVEEYTDVEVDFPDAQTMHGFDTLEIDIVMECPDPDTVEFNNCGAWDYLAHMWIYDESTESWLEMGRFITTYHRESRWVVDASHALGWLQEGGTRQLRYKWAHSWNTQPTAVTANIRLSNQAKGMAPREVIPLFTGATFSSTYNDREAVEASIPADAAKVELVAITTGHGMETGNCAEFCYHEHHYTVGSNTFSQEFTEPGIDDGCAQMVSDGVVPNQGGTWWFGRGGWCPGQRVDPFVVDVSQEAAAGDSVSVSYRATQGGNEPSDGRGNIEHRSWLIIHR